MAQAEYEIYKRIKLLGQGAFGKAFLVECLKDNTLCVIKQVDLNNLPENEKRETIKEAKILEALKHPNIVKFKEVYKTKKGKLCIVMDFADGGDLTKKIEAAKGSFISETQIVDWFTQICLAMKHVHDRKILHRDLKCQNIFLTKNGMIKLGDFGIARVLSSTRENARTMVGTPYYLSPEIIDNKPYSFKSDIWSLGVVLYELCALRPPFDAASLPQLAVKIVKGNYNPIPSHYSRELRNLVGCLLELNPSKRPSVHDVLKMPIITNRIRKFLSESVRLDEFSHTILHNQRPLDLRMRMEDVKQVNNEAPMPQSDLRLLLLQEKKQKENQERAERDKLERDRLEKERRLRMEREKNEREKMEKIRKERDRLEQELREKENRIFGNKNNLKLQGEGGNQPYSNRPYMGHTPYTPGPNLLNRNKPEVFGNQAQTPNVGANRNNGFGNLFRRDREVKPVLYAAPSKEVIPTKEIINEVNVRRDISPIRDILHRRERPSENPENKAVNNSNSAANENAARPSASDKNANEGNENNMLGLQYRVEETKSDKTERNHKASPSSKDVQVAKTKVENSSFKEKEKEKEKEVQRRKKVVSREPKEKSKKKEELQEMIIKSESKQALESKEARLAEIRSKLDEERKRMRDDIASKKKSFKKGDAPFDVEVYMPTSPSMDEDEKDDFNRNDDEDEKPEDVQQAQPEEEKHNLDMTVEEENLIDMIQEMQKIVEEASDKDGENAPADEENNKDAEERDDDEEETYNYQKDEAAPFKDISNLTNNENRPSTNFANMSLKDYLDETLEKENSNKILEDSKKLISDLLEDIHLPVEDYSLRLKNQLCEKHSNHSTLPSMAYTFLFQALSEL